MIANYHTHTFRCGHAEGHEREYATRAAEAGLRTLGFADHTPYDFFDVGPRNRPMRMMPEELPEYADSVRRLKEEYAGRMEIRLGLEAEYYPRYFPRLLELVRGEGVEYLLLGQHFLHNEVDGAYAGMPTTDAKALDAYVSQSMEAMETGLFTYFAHPDLFHFTGDESTYERAMARLCRKARETDTPLEINLLGLREGRNYPDPFFWQIAAEEGCRAVLGSDAHRPQWVTDPAGEEKALRMAERLGLEVLTRVPLRRLDPGI